MPVRKRKEKERIDKNFTYIFFGNSLMIHFVRCHFLGQSQAGILARQSHQENSRVIIFQCLICFFRSYVAMEIPKIY